MIASLYLGTFVMALDTNIINVAVPKISADFDALEQVAWYGSAYLLTLTACQTAFGTLYKYFDITVVYRSCIFIFEGMLLLHRMDRIADCSQWDLLLRQRRRAHQCSS